MAARIAFWAAGAPVERLLDAAHGPVVVRHHPGGVRWKTCSSRPRAGSPARTGSPRPRPDHGHPLAGQVVLVVPLAEWKVVPSNVSRPGRSGTFGLAAAPARDQDVGRELALRGLEAPEALSSSQPAPRSSWSKRMCGGRRSARRSRAGSRGSRAAGERSPTNRGSARTRTSRGARARRSGSPGRCCPATCRRRRRHARAPRSRRGPPAPGLMAIPRPENPVPTMTIE